MSVVTLLKDHKGKKAGAVIPNVPFLEAKDLVAAGIAVRTNQPAAKPLPPNEGDAVAALNERVGVQAAEIERLKADGVTLSAALEKANKAGGDKTLAAEHAKLKDEFAKLQAEHAKLIATKK